MSKKRSATIETIEDVMPNPITEETDVETEIVKKQETVIYIGPTIHGVVVESTIFKNGLPNALNEKIKEQPFITKFIVPLDEMMKKKAEIHKNGTALNIFYNMINTK